MSKIIFEFNTSGDNGVYEKEEAFRCIKSLDLALALSDMAEIFNTDDLSLKDVDIVEELADRYYSVLERYNIDLDELIS